MKIILVILLQLLIVSCVKTGSNEHETFKEVEEITPAPDTGPEKVKVSYEQIKKNIIEPFGCVNCHGWARTEIGIKEKLVEGEPFSSRIYTKIEDGSMPPFGGTVDKTRLELLEQYIRDLKE